MNGTKKEMIKTHEGVTAVDEAIEWASQLKPMKELKHNAYLFDHVLA